MVSNNKCLSLILCKEVEALHALSLRIANFGAEFPVVCKIEALFQSMSVCLKLSCPDSKMRLNPG